MLGRDKILHKVRSLMAKTVDAGCTEEEAMAALARAQAMIDAYEVSDEELKLTKEQKAVFKSHEDTRDPYRIKWLLCMGVSEFTGTKAFYNPRAKKISFLGLPSDVEFAFFLLAHLQGFVQAELVKYMVTVPVRGTERRKYSNGFTQGCTGRINDRLFALAKESQKATVKASDNRFALVVAKSAAIKDFIDENLGGKIGKSSNSYSRKGYSEARAEGRKAGDRATFSRAVGSGAVRSTLLGSK